ncbi:D-alanyl-D-alanine-carboxypeptidase / D-alanyl-D-alanine-endopeptidase [Methylobacterium sp. 174MFSha1.1]|uniref:D-alanyl-D-alanine- carboxypeptidase/endopeptidase AmpH n=1 Tax=Methylobacterium sp. 174MFSha1.1 TaxID=1502749 RepID=UPI0008ED651F|nr:D-alanyl-D-alanine-carboxypeptidase/endopeptidase AmpH [Methylobacterium sp. 174MFSha1.1]SFV17198.1 D-alanyl-D-alanine-carboxypeptidase / D-alanyl-D-alanine-endopeptidase [Methylobacterium sp. 174MFSha1.1]
MLHWRDVVLSACLMIAPVGQAAAADLALREAAALAGMAMYLDSGAPGLVLAVLRGDESLVLGFGETAPGSGIEPDGRSIVRLGSVSKVFATDLLASLAAGGRVGLADPLSRYAPAGVTIPMAKAGGRAISLLDLATHAAGLPRELPDPGIVPGPGGNPFSVFRIGYYWDWLAANGPAYPPGTRLLYSNAGFGLLGDALARAAGKPYGTLLEEVVTGPLGLRDTGPALTEAQAPRLMTGLGPFGKPDPNAPAPAAMAASGGLTSTADDMVRWMRWHLADDQAGQAARSLAHAVWRSQDGMKALVGVEATEADGIGLGWIASPAEHRVPALLGKSGGIGGFMTYVVLSPNRRLGIFVAATRVSFALSEGLRRGVRTLAAELAGDP